MMILLKKTWGVVLTFQRRRTEKQTATSSWFSLTGRRLVGPSTSLRQFWPASEEPWQKLREKVHRSCNFVFVLDILLKQTTFKFQSFALTPNFGSGYDEIHDEGRQPVAVNVAVSTLQTYRIPM